MLDLQLDDDDDEDDFSDEYDFVDEEDEAQMQRRAARKLERQLAKQPTRVKYMQLLQKVANRIEDEITIELDDLAEVS